MIVNKYLAAVDNLIKAIDIAIKSVKKYPPINWDDEAVNQFVDVYIMYKERRINCEKKFQNLSSLKYNVQDIFTYFQECSGPDVEEFWKQIKEADLPYKRENKLAKILKRRKINNDIEYDFVTDVIVPYQQEGLINEEESLLLKKYLGDFEMKVKK